LTLTEVFVTSINLRNCVGATKYDIALTNLQMTTQLQHIEFCNILKVTCHSLPCHSDIATITFILTAFSTNHN
jgi:hypothetical protein